MIDLINGYTGTPVKVPVELVERFKAAGFYEPAAPAPEPVEDAVEKPSPRPRKRRSSSAE